MTQEPFKLPSSLESFRSRFELRETELRQLEILRNQAEKFLEEKNYMGLAQDLADLVDGYQPGDEPTKAVFILGRCVQILSGIKAALTTIELYESKKQSVKEMRESLSQYDLQGPAGNLEL